MSSVFIIKEGRMLSRAEWRNETHNGQDEGSITCVCFISWPVTVICQNQRTHADSHTHMLKEETVHYIYDDTRKWFMDGTGRCQTIWLCVVWVEF